MALLPQFLWPLVIALWVAAIAVALIAGLVGLWSEMGPATFLILSPVGAFLLLARRGQGALGQGLELS